MNKNTTVDWNSLTTWWLNEWFVQEGRKTQSNGSQSIYLMYCCHRDVLCNVIRIWITQSLY